MKNTSNINASQIGNEGLNRYNESKCVDPAITSFDSLPDTAHVRLPVVIALFACSRATVWRHVKSGLIPRPIKFSERITVWNVGVLRRKLMEMTSNTR